jgi:hypothetical protein
VPILHTGQSIRVPEIGSLARKFLGLRHAWLETSKPVGFAPREGFEGSQRYRIRRLVPSGSRY